MSASRAFEAERFRSVTLSTAIPDKIAALVLRHLLSMAIVTSHATHVSHRSRSGLRLSFKGPGAQWRRLVLIAQLLFGQMIELVVSSRRSPACCQSSYAHVHPHTLETTTSRGAEIGISDCRSAQSMSQLGHVWTAPWQELSDVLKHWSGGSRVRPVFAAGYYGRWP